MFGKKKTKQPEIIRETIKQCKFCESKELFQLRVSDMLTCYDWQWDVFCCRDCGRVMSEKDFKVITLQDEEKQE